MDGLHFNSAYVRKVIIYRTAEIISCKTAQQWELTEPNSVWGWLLWMQAGSLSLPHWTRANPLFLPLELKSLKRTTGCRTQIILSSHFDYLYLPPSPHLWEIIARKPTKKQQCDNVYLSTQHQAERSRSSRSFLGCIVSLRPSQLH